MENKNVTQAKEYLDAGKSVHYAIGALMIANAEGDKKKVAFMAPEFQTFQKWLHQEWMNLTDEYKRLSAEAEATQREFSAYCAAHPERLDPRTDAHWTAEELCRAAQMALSRQQDCYARRDTCFTIQQKMREVFFPK